MLMHLETLDRSASAGARKAPPIDMAHLEAQALGDSGLEAEMLRLFDQLLANQLSRLAKATIEAQMLEPLHTVRAASRGVGAWPLAEEARMLERRIASGMPASDADLHGLALRAAELRGFIAAHIALAEAA
jgi:hypothetical protein